MVAHRLAWPQRVDVLLERPVRDAVARPGAVAAEAGGGGEERRGEEGARVEGFVPVGVWGGEVAEGGEEGGVCGDEVAVEGEERALWVGVRALLRAKKKGRRKD